MLLDSDAQMIFLRYETHTNTWTRWLFKCLSKYTPGVLKSILPKCFSNKMEQAEKETKKEYEDYCQFLRSKIKSLEALPQAETSTKDTKDKKNGLSDSGKTSDTSTDSDDPLSADEEADLQRAYELSLQKNQDLIQGNPDDPTPTGKDVNGKDHQEETPTIDQTVQLDETNRFTKIALTPEAKAQKLQKEIASAIEGIQCRIKRLQDHQTTPLSYRRYLLLLQEISDAVIFLNKNAGEKQFTDELKLDEVSLKALSKKMPITNNAVLVNLYVKGTAWEKDLKELSEQKGYIQFSATPQGRLALTKDDARVSEHDLEEYRGPLKLNLPAIENLKVIDTLIDYLEKNAKCLPSSLEISSVLKRTRGSAESTRTRINTRIIIETANT